VHKSTAFYAGPFPHLRHGTHSGERGPTHVTPLIGDSVLFYSRGPSVNKTLQTRRDEISESKYGAGSGLVLVRWVAQ
jgi:hypothetical protein